MSPSSRTFLPKRAEEFARQEPFSTLFFELPWAITYWKMNS
jgi:hypothetical protein